MNLPGTAEGNWRWRCTEEMLKPSVFERLGDLTSASGRRHKFAAVGQTKTMEAVL
jgi:4-alpha-glucanotransferase